MRLSAGLRRLRSLAPLAGLAGIIGATPLHTALKRSEPARDSRLAAPPTRISLWFTAKPELAFSRIRIVPVPSGPEIVLDTIVADTGHALHAGIPGRLRAGSYRVVWQTASSDGHPIRGEFVFTVLPSIVDTMAIATDAATAAALAAGVARDSVPTPSGLTSPSRLVDASLHSEYRAVRWMEFVALLTVLGVLGFRHGVLPPLASRGVPTADAADRARRYGQYALVIYGVAAVTRLYTESAALTSPDAALKRETLEPLLSSTTWGIGWLFGAIGAVVLLAGWWISKRTVSFGTPLALSGALGMTLSPAFTGHAAASDNFIASVTLDVLHIAAASVWIGGLLMVVVVGIPAMRRLTDGNPDAAVSALVNSFHPVALFCAPLVVVAGLGTSWLRLGGLDALFDTSYGRTLLVKLGLFLVLATMAGYNSMRARRTLGTPQGTAHLRRTAVIELGFAALVLAATSFLVTQPVPSDMALP